MQVAHNKNSSKKRFKIKDIRAPSLRDHTGNTMGPQTMADALRKNFLGSSPAWYKLTIIGFLILNPILYIATTPFFAGWCLVIEFIFTLAMALKCYPLLLGLAIVFWAPAAKAHCPHANHPDPEHCSVEPPPPHQKQR